MIPVRFDQRHGQGFVQSPQQHVGHIAVARGTGRGRLVQVVQKPGHTGLQTSENKKNL